MIILIAGIHGVGKSYLGNLYASMHTAIHTSASKLIKEELKGANWTNDKSVSDVEKNQLALLNAIKKFEDDRATVLLDGHFVLIGPLNNLIPIDDSVFRDLNLSAVILLEAPMPVVADRLRKRDGVVPNIDLQEFMEKERECAVRVCGNLNLPLQILNAPDSEQFNAALNAHITNH